MNIGKNILLALALIGVFLLGMVTATTIINYYFPTTGETATYELNFTWLDGTPITTINWGITKNNTEYVLEPMNITNLSNIPVTLTLSYQYSFNIISLTLTWNYTGAILPPNESVIVELYQTAETSGKQYGYTTVISAEEA